MVRIHVWGKETEKQSLVVWEKKTRARTFLKRERKRRERESSMSQSNDDAWAKRDRGGVVVVVGGTNPGLRSTAKGRDREERKRRKDCDAL